LKRSNARWNHFTRTLTATQRVQELSQPALQAFHNLAVREAAEFHATSEALIVGCWTLGVGRFLLAGGAVPPIIYGRSRMDCRALRLKLPRIMRRFFPTAD
jgi:hypothetical protein